MENNTRQYLKDSLEFAANKCQDIYESNEVSEQFTKNFDAFINENNFNKRFGPGPFMYAYRLDRQLSKMINDLFEILFIEIAQ